MNDIVNKSSLEFQNWNYFVWGSERLQITDCTLQINHAILSTVL